MSLKGKKVLVTGGCGFVGSHVVKKLVMEGAKVYVLDLFYDEKSYFKTEGLDKKVTFIPGSVTDYELVLTTITNNEVELVYHLAAQAIVPIAYYTPRNTLNINVMGTVNVLNACNESNKIRGVIVASSDKAYGNLKIGKNEYKETDKLEGLHPYDVSKSCTDLITRAYFCTYELPVVITRFGNIYGPGDNNYSRLIPGAIKSMIEGETFEIRSDGKSVREYVYVEEVANAYVLMGEKFYDSSLNTEVNFVGHAFNLGSGEFKSVMGVVDEIKQNHERFNIKILNNTKSEIKEQRLNSQKVKDVVGWVHKTSFSNGLEKTVEWYRGVLKK